LHFHAASRVRPEWEEKQMSRLIGFVFAACLLAIATSTGVTAASPDWPKSLTLATASPGGIYYVYGEALTQILTEKLGIPVNPLPTQGSIHNLKLLDSGTAQLGLIVMGTGLQGWNGTGDWTSGKQYRKMRALFPMYDAPFQAMALRRSGITNFAQLDKKRIGVGPKAGANGTYPPAIFKLLGISTEINFGSYSVMATEFLAGRIDAIVTLFGAPMPAIQDVEAKEPVTFFSLSPEQIEAIRKAMPEFSPSKIAAGTYRSLDKDYVTIGVYNFAIGRADLPDDLVYQLVKAVFENQPRLVKANSAASDTIPQNADKNTFLPFHPGAVRYYREIGISIPDSLVPTN
jgi:TRAP transporter TAXI family solute receptor